VGCQQEKKRKKPIRNKKIIRRIIFFLAGTKCLKELAGSRTQKIREYLQNSGKLLSSS
jgi:hypothetical protein